MAEIFSRHGDDERLWACTVEFARQVENLLRGEDVRKACRQSHPCRRESPEPESSPGWSPVTSSGTSRIDENDGSEVAHSVGQFGRQLMQAEDLNVGLEELILEGIGRVPRKPVIESAEGSRKQR